MGARRPAHFSDARRDERGHDIDPNLDAWDAKALARDIASAAFPGSSVAVSDGGPDGPLWRVVVGGEEAGAVDRVRLDAPPWAAPAWTIELRLGALPLAAPAPRSAHAYVAGGAASAPVERVRYRPLPTMPAASFDLAFIVPEALPAARVEAVLRQTGGELLERVELFDEFRDGMVAGSRSLAWRLTFRHPERTLNEKEIAGRRQKLIAMVEKELGVVSRSV